MKNSDKTSVSVDVSNTGDVDVNEVIQLYVTDQEASVRTPISSLKSFKKQVIKAGETTTVEFELTSKMLELIDNDGQSVLEPGIFNITVGNASPSSRSLALGASQPQVIEIEVME